MTVSKRWPKTNNFSGLSEKQNERPAARALPDSCDQPLYVIKLMKSVLSKNGRGIVA